MNEQYIPSKLSVWETWSLKLSPFKWNLKRCKSIYAFDYDSAWIEILDYLPATFHYMFFLVDKQFGNRRIRR